MSKDALVDLLVALGGLQESAVYSDLTIKCGDATFDVHKAAISTRSKSFETVCSGGVGPSGKNEVDLADHDPEIVELMIDYFYQLDHSDILDVSDTTEAKESSEVEAPSSNTESDQKPVNVKDINTWYSMPGTCAAGDIDGIVAWDYGLLHKQRMVKEQAVKVAGAWESRVTQETVDKNATTTKQNEDRNLSGLKCGHDSRSLIVNLHVCALADKFQILPLRKLAKSKFQAAITHHWQSEAFVEAAALVFDSTPSNDSGLRGVVVDTFKKHGELLHYGEVESLLESENGIAWYLLRAHFPKSVKK